MFSAFPTGGTCLFTDTICLTSGNYLGAYKSADGLPLDSSTANIPASGLVLHPGQKGEDSFDATGFSLVATQVPEPATWLLMIGGLSLIGVAMRRRRGKIVAA